MEKVNSSTIEMEQKTRDIFCDCCQTHLGTIIEYANGYTTTPKPLPVKSYYNEGICLDNKWIHIKGRLCEKCRKEVNEKIRDAFWGIATHYRLECIDEAAKD
jgi:hypothetical protein